MEEYSLILTMLYVILAVAIIHTTDKLSTRNIKLEVQAIELQFQLAMKTELILLYEKMIEDRLGKEKKNG